MYVQAFRLPCRGLLHSIYIGLYSAFLPEIRHRFLALLCGVLLYFVTNFAQNNPNRLYLIIILVKINHIYGKNLA